MKRPTSPAPTITTSSSDVFVHPTQVFSAEQSAIISHISSHVVLHRSLQAGLALIDKIIQENKVLSEPRHGIFIGDSGCGKTTLRDVFTAGLPTQHDEFQLGLRANIPVLVVSLPSKITPKSMVCQMLRALGDRSSLHGTYFELMERLCRLIKDCNVQLVWIDEFQHLLSLGRGGSRGASGRLREAQDSIKSLINNTHVSFILMGMPEIDALIEKEDQISRRFTHLHVMAPFQIPSDHDNDLVNFVNDLLIGAVQQLPYFSSADYLTQGSAHAERMFIASRGVPSRLKDLVKNAALEAYRRNSRTIEWIDFATVVQELAVSQRMRAEAFERRAKQSRRILEGFDGQYINPFAANDEQIHQFAMRAAVGS